ncbi:PAS domain S-box-containing protein [Pseudomonas fluvialis]|uniref:PAS domain S-box-containing protein n=1 Tax=Pseudomonas fluvialis TaxID=1793966 RepID=A0A7X0BTU3_9PSED|nr:PAS domain S-box-containing protein [Pseudomonas fluvialis]
MLLRLATLIFCLLALPAWADAPAPLTLTEAQRAWLRAHGPLRVGIVLQPPYAQFDRRQQRLSGANVELMEWLGQALGVSWQWQHYASQDELQAALRAGAIDLAPGLLQTPAGLRLWQYSDPYLRVPHLVVGERSHTGAVELDALEAGSAVSVASNSPVLAYLRSNFSNLDLRPSPDEQAALQQVINQTARFAVADEAQLSRLSRLQEFSELAVVGDIGFPLLLRVASRRDQPQLAELIGSALRNLSPQQLNQLHDRWLQIQYPRLSESPGLWQNISLLLLALLLASAAIITWLLRQRSGLEKRLLDARLQLSQQLAAEEALRLAQFAIDQSTVGILWVNWDSRVRYANAAAEQMLGYPAGAVVDRPLADFEPGLHMDRWLGLWRRARQPEEGALSFETQCVRADGSLLPVDVSISFLRFGESEYLLVFLSDVTERRRAHAALEESEARLKGIAGNVPGLVFRLERAAPGAPVLFAYMSEASQGLLGYSAEFLSHADRGIRSLAHPDDQADYRAIQDAALAADRDWQWQGRLLTQSGEQRWVDIKATARRFEDGRVVWDGIVWDISANKAIELALGESRAQLRELSAHLESVREEEKARIAREVHDELGQVLTVLKLETSMCELAYADLDPGLQARLDSMKKLIASLFQLVRDVATALRPPILDAGIASAIEWQARRFEARSQIPCLVEVPEQLPALSDAKAIGLFRVLQEALTNILRHAQAHSVEISLRAQGHQLCLRVSDDGRGFDPAAVHGSFGLVGMRERVLMLGGTLSLDSHPGAGTTLCVYVALDEETEQ